MMICAEKEKLLRFMSANLGAWSTVFDSEESASPPLTAYPDKVHTVQTGITVLSVQSEQTQIYQGLAAYALLGFPAMLF